jgi:hypothetical protein
MHTDISRYKAKQADEKTKIEATLIIFTHVFNNRNFDQPDL